MAKQKLLHNKNWRWILFLATAGLVGYFAYRERTQLADSIEVLKRADLAYISPILLATFGTVFFASVILIGSAPKKLKILRTFIFQLANSVVTRVTPKGIGGFYLTEQYLEHHRVSRSRATGSVSIMYTVGTIVHIGMFFSTAFLFNRDFLDSVGLNGASISIGLTVLLIALMGLYLVPKIQKKVEKWASQTAKSFAAIVFNPLKFSQLFGGSIALNLCYGAALLCSVLAVGGSISFFEAVLVYLGAGILSAAAPTPSGLGANEAAMVVTLGLLDINVSTAIAAVLLFRLATYWLPIAPGVVALRYLQKKHIL